ncbi:unnamed protein product [Anisakis simplex]|uniref:Uncharacterized protein n=1 Tax=Anisakis simplex TaxID=6269 RepID=A0A0M3K626_ANISI|nr:unnamed protein product [Anisakis simplex]
MVEDLKRIEWKLGLLKFFCRFATELARGKFLRNAKTWPICAHQSPLTFKIIWRVARSIENDALSINGLVALLEVERVTDTTTNTAKGGN